jgi:hypothetical protein
MKFFTRISVLCSVLLAFAQSVSAQSFAIKELATNLIIPALAAPVLSAPDVLSGDNSVAVPLAWTSVSGATSYVVESAFNNQVFGFVTSQSTASFSDTVLKTGSYSYRVRACNGSGCGPVSNVDMVAVTVVVPTIPAKVSSLDVQYGSAGNFLIWNDSLGANFYDVESMRPGSGQGGLFTRVGSYAHGRITVSFSGGSPRDFVYRVRACNNVGCSAWTLQSTFP